MNRGGPESRRVRTETKQQRGGSPFSERGWGWGDRILIFFSWDLEPEAERKA